MSYTIADGLELSDEQRSFIELAKDFADQEIRPRARAVDEADTEAPMDLWKKATEVGLVSYMLPSEYGGGA